MKSRTARLAATAGAVALLGALAATAPAVAAPAPASATAQVAASQFIDWYPNKEQCQSGGAYYLRHGYSSYICQLDPMRGWALYVS
ncbi:hypothetical protein ACIO87_21645 [Streptomyces sp. NPDC087218]|uniref:hypothetical protein n=1 Tax=Streptomyces sp. NPDC087218 TaxID=3365769 RepID=UPI0037FAC77E